MNSKDQIVEEPDIPPFVGQKAAVPAAESGVDSLIASVQELSRQHDELSYEIYNLNQKVLHCQTELSGQRRRIRSLAMGVYVLGIAAIGLLVLVLLLPLK